MMMMMMTTMIAATSNTPTTTPAMIAPGPAGASAIEGAIQGACHSVYERVFVYVCVH